MTPFPKVREMNSIAALQSNLSRRRGLEQEYFRHFYAQGVRLKRKYRP